MKALSDSLGKIISGLLFVAILVLVAVTFFQVLARFVFKIPIVWSEEVVRMSFVWLISLGSAIAVKERTHLALDILVSELSDRWQYFVRMIVLALIFFAALILCIAGFDYVIRNIGKTAVTMPIPSNSVYISAPISGVLIMFFAIEQFILQTKAYYKKGDQ